METDITKILQIAARSPSSHNTQPWKARIEGDGLVIGYAPERQLFVGDPGKRELFISLGCYAESILLASEDQGYVTSVAFLGKDSGRVARISFKKSTVKKHADWGELIQRRRSDRRLYDERPLATEVKDRLEGLEYDSARLKLFTGRKDIDYLADKTYQATESLMSPQEFRDELASWVRNNWTREPDGMPGYTQGMPGPISLLAKFVIRKNPKVAVSQAKKDGKRVRRSAAVGLVCVTDDSPKGWFAAGRLYQRLCLLAEKEGVRTAAVSAAIISPDTAKAIGRRFGSGAIPVVLVRLGYKAGSVKATPRRPVSDVLSKG